MADGTNTTNWIETYLSRGWSLVPLHDMAAGTCSCGLNDPEHDRKQGGKHPRYAKWQINVIRDIETARAVWTAHPDANIGIATGASSRVWILDVDPDNGGMTAIADLIFEHGSDWVETYMVETGSGGVHYYFTMPADFEPTNRRGALPRGIDVRGTGGQVVAPPSVSGKGAYRVLCDVPVAPAPGWLLELIRPPIWDAPPHGGLLSTQGPAHADIGGARGTAYAAAAVEALVAELGAALEGTRNETAFRVACRLLELVNAPWSGLAADVAYGAYLSGAGRADGNGAPFPRAEADSVWAHAVRQVGGGAAVLPPSEIAGEPLPLPGAANRVSLATNSSSAYSERSDPFCDPGPAALPMAGVTGVTSQVRGVTGAVTTGTTTGVTALLDQMLTAEQLRAIPPPEPLIAGLLNLDSTSWLIGKSGSFKSFVALDWAAHVGRGQAWQGLAVRQGLAVCVVAEGARGVRLRVDAWERAYGPLKDVLFLPRPVQVRGVEWPALIEACHRLAPALIVLDTQARISIGLDENSNTDMGLYIQAIDQLRQATGACVLSVHHIGRNGSDARGASAIDAAQDAEIRAARVGAYAVELHVDKQKDRQQAGPIRLALRTVGGEIDPETGEGMSSLVIEQNAAAVPIEEKVERGTARARVLYSIMRDVFDVGDGGTRAEIGALFKSHPCLDGCSPDVRRKAWSLAWGQLVDRGLIAKMERQERFRIIVVPDQTEEGVLTRNRTAEPPAGWYMWRPVESDSE